MIERDKFAFAALACIMQSDGDSEVVVDDARNNGTSEVASFAEAAYEIGDAMFKESVKRNGTTDEFRMAAV